MLTLPTIIIGLYCEGYKILITIVIPTEASTIDVLNKTCLPPNRGLISSSSPPNQGKFQNLSPPTNRLCGTLILPPAAFLFENRISFYRLCRDESLIALNPGILN